MRLHSDLMQYLHGFFYLFRNQTTLHKALVVRIEKVLVTEQKKNRVSRSGSRTVFPKDRSADQLWSANILKLVRGNFLNRKHVEFGQKFDLC